MPEITVSNIVPLKQFILIEPLNRTEETTSGLILPEEKYTPTPVVGKVLRAGADSQFVAGDIVFFRRYSTDELKFATADGIEQLVSLISDDEVVAKIQTKQYPNGS